MRAPRSPRPALILALLTCGAAHLALASSADATAPPKAPHSARSRQQPLAGIGVFITSITPTPAVAAGDTVQVKGTVSSQSGHLTSGASIQLRYSATPVSTRAQLADTAPFPALTSRLADRKPLPAPSASSASNSWTLKLAATKLQATDLGVYPLTIEVIDRAGRPLAEQHTFVVYTPRQLRKQVQPTRVAWIWPLIDQPHRAGDGLFLDDRLTTDLDSGRLRQLLDAGKSSAGTPITWAIDPALVKDAQDLASKGYQVTGPGGRGTTHRPASAAAQRWLSDVKGAATSYFAMPFADPDSVALTHQGLTSQLKLAYEKRSQVAAVLGGRPPSPAMAWPADGVIDQSALDQLARLDPTQAILLSSDMLPSTVRGQAYTPDAATRVSTRYGKRDALAYDATISKVVSADSQSPGTAVLIQQRFLAETAMVTAELPSTSRTLIIAPDRRWNPGPGVAADLLKLTGAPWLKQASLSDLTTSVTADRTLGAYPHYIAKRELPKTYLKGTRQSVGIAELSAKAADLATIFLPGRPGEPAHGNGFRDGALRAESSAWRGHRRQADAFLGTLTQQVDDYAATVRILANRTMAIAGRKGVALFTVNNRWDTTVQVRVDVVSQNPHRLQIGRYQQVMIIDPKHNAPLNVPMNVMANGFTNVLIQLYTPDGKVPIGPAHTVQVRTTGLSTTALLITASALIVLLVTVSMRARRARRRRRETAGPDAPTTSEEARNTPRP